MSEFVRMERIVSKKAYICNAEVRTESLAGELAVDSSSVNVGNVSDTNVENIAGNPTHCRTRLRHTAEGRNN